jgi:hypothetical protein
MSGNPRGTAKRCDGLSCTVPVPEEVGSTGRVCCPLGGVIYRLPDYAPCLA